MRYAPPFLGIYSHSALPILSEKRDIMRTAVPSPQEITRDAVPACSAVKSQSCSSQRLYEDSTRYIPLSRKTRHPIREITFQETSSFHHGSPDVVGSSFSLLAVVAAISIDVCLPCL